MKLYNKQNKYCRSHRFSSCTNQHTALHVGHSENKSNYGGDRVLGTGHCSVLSERRWRKPAVELEGSTEQQSASPLKQVFLLSHQIPQNRLLWVDSICFMNAPHKRRFISKIHQQNYIQRDLAVILAREHREPL